MTVQDLIKSTLRLLGAIGQGEDPTAKELEDAREALNLMLDTWQVLGYVSPLQYSDLVSDIKHPKVLQRAMKYNLAIEIAPEYGIVVSAEVVAVANSSLQAIRNPRIVVPEIDIGLPFPEHTYDGMKN